MFIINCLFDIIAHRVKNSDSGHRLVILKSAGKDAHVTLSHAGTGMLLLLVDWTVDPRVGISQQIMFQDHENQFSFHEMQEKES